MITALRFFKGTVIRFRVGVAGCFVNSFTDIRFRIFICGETSTGFNWIQLNEFGMPDIKWGQFCYLEINKIAPLSSNSGEMLHWYR